MAEHFHAGPTIALQLRRDQRRTAAGERIDDPPTSLADSHKLAHQRCQLALEMVLVDLRMSPCSSSLFKVRAFGVESLRRPAQGGKETFRILVEQRAAALQSGFDASPVIA